MADFTGRNYVPSALLTKMGESAMEEPTPSFQLPRIVTQTIPGGYLGGGGGTVVTNQLIYRGVLNGNYVYNTGSPPGGAINVVILGQITS